MAASRFNRSSPASRSPASVFHGLHHALREQGKALGAASLALWRSIAAPESVPSRESEGGVPVESAERAYGALGAAKRGPSLLRDGVRGRSACQRTFLTLALAPGPMPESASGFSLPFPGRRCRIQGIGTNKRTTTTQHWHFHLHCPRTVSVPSSSVMCGGTLFAGASDQRQDRRLDMLRQLRPSFLNECQVGVQSGIFGVWCAGFCARGFRNRRFR